MERKKKRRDGLNGVSKQIRLIMKFSGISLAGVTLFYLLPFTAVIYYSVVDNPIQRKFVFLDNFIALCHNDAFLLALKNTAEFTIAVVLLQVVLSTVFALMLETAIPFKSGFRVMLLSPLVVPAASVILVWQILFDNNGSVNQFIATLGFEKIKWFSSSYSIIVIILLYTWKNLGYNMLIMMNGIQSVPKELIESAKMDGAGSWMVFWKIKLRYLEPSIVFVTIISVLNSYKIFREIYLLTGDHPYESLYFLQHYMNNMLRSLDYQKLSAAAVLIALITLTVFFVIYCLEDIANRDLEV